jgi:RHS repeat-associated protein
MADWLGTKRAFFSLAGTEGGGGAHAPFGEWYGNPAGSSSDFTGQLGDGAQNNSTYYFPERQYRSSQGRWLSPDPAGMGAVDPSDPQSWNRYAYVGNAPLNRVDPQGLDWGGWGGGGWGGGGGGFSFSISFGSGGVSFGVGMPGMTNCFGVPCDMRVAQQVRAVVQAVKDKNWGALLGIGLGELGTLEQNLIDANKGCEFGGECFADSDNANALAAAMQATGALNFAHPCVIASIPLAAGAGAVIGADIAAEAGVTSATSEALAAFRGYKAVKAAKRAALYLGTVTGLANISAKVQAKEKAAWEWTKQKVGAACDAAAALPPK